jgi:3-oxoadipate enol-lactonase
MCRCCRFLLPVLFVLLFVAGCARVPEGPSPGAPVKASSYHRLVVPGGELEYRTRGRGEPVLLIHGSVLADVFEPMLNDPALDGYRLITYHRRGYVGSSRAATGFTIEQQALDALAVLDELGAARAHIAGQSYGGAIALALARRYPQRVASLILMEPATPAFDGEPDPQFMEAVTAALQLYGEGEVRNALMRFANAVTPGGWDALSSAGLTHMQEQAVEDGATFFEVEMPALMQWSFTPADAERITIPSLVMFGAESRRTFRVGAQALAQALPNAELKEIFGAGHELQMKQPHAVAEALSTFLRQHRVK